MTPEEQAEHAQDLGEMLAAFNATMDAVVPESQYYRGEREDDDKIAAYGDIMQRAAARRAERVRRAAER